MPKANTFIRKLNHAGKIKFGLNIDWYLDIGERERKKQQLLHRYVFDQISRPVIDWMNVAHGVGNLIANDWGFSSHKS